MDTPHMQVDTEQAGWETQRAFPFHGSSVAPYSNMGFSFQPLVEVDVPCGSHHPPPPPPLTAVEFEEAEELRVEEGAQLRGTQRLFDLVLDTTATATTAADAEDAEDANARMDERGGEEGDEERDVAGRRRRRRRRG